MASPFTIFRKHRKAFIAALTIMTMFGFVFIPMILDTIRFKGPGDPVAVSTKKYGKLTQNELGRKVDQRRRVSTILQEARREAIRPDFISQFRKIYGKLMGAEFIEAQAIRLADQQAKAWVTQRLGETSQEAVVSSWLLAHRAEELGMAVTNDTVNQFLKQVSNGRFDNKAWEKFFERHGITDKQFFALLRTELLAMRFGEMFGPSLGGTTPAQQWDYFTRLNREATIEALPVRVADYVEKIEDPDEKTLRAFFEEHKNDFDFSTSPRPGFRQPERVNVRYFRLVPSQIAKSISRAAIKEYIEKNKVDLERAYEAAHKKPEDKKPEDKKPEDKKPENKKTEDKKTEDKKTEDKKTEDKKTEDKKTEDKKTEDKKTEDKKTEDKKTEDKKTEDKKTEEKKIEDKKIEDKKIEDKKTEDKKTEDKKTEDKKTEEGKTEEKKPEAKEAEGMKTDDKTSEDKKTEEEKPEAKKTEEKTAEEEKPEPKAPAKESEADKTSALSSGAPFQFTSLLQDAPEANKTAETADDKTATKTAEMPPEKPEDKPPAKTEDKTAEKPDMLVPEPTAIEGKPGAEKPESKEEPGAEKKPDITLESLIPEVIQMNKQQWIEDRARRELTDQQVEDAKTGLQTAIKGWSEKQRTYEAQPVGKAPKPLDFQALAAKYGLTTDETGLRSMVEMNDLEIAKSSDNQQGFLGLVYSDRSESSRAPLSKYQAAITAYQGALTKTFAQPEQITFVFYKTEDQPEKVADWDEDTAKTKWKEVQARKLAFEAAEALAKKVPRGSEEKLKEIFPGGKVVEVGPFTWMTEGVAARTTGSREPPSISKLDGIDRPGDDFMRTVFSLSPGEVGVAMNNPESRGLRDPAGELPAHGREPVGLLRVHPACRVSQCGRRRRRADDRSVVRADQGRCRPEMGNPARSTRYRTCRKVVS